MPGEEDDRLGVAALGQMTLQVETACSGHAHIEDEATGTVQYAGVEQLAGRGEADRLEPRRQDQLGQRLPNRGVVVDNDDERLFRFASSWRC